MRLPWGRRAGTRGVSGRGCVPPNERDTEQRENLFWRVERVRDVRAEVYRRDEDEAGKHVVVESAALAQR